MGKNLTFIFVVSIDWNIYTLGVLDEQSHYHFASSPHSQTLSERNIRGGIIESGGFVFASRNLWAFRTNHSTRLPKGLRYRNSHQRELLCRFKRIFIRETILSIFIRELHRASCDDLKFFSGMVELRELSFHFCRPSFDSNQFTSLTQLTKLRISLGEYADLDVVGIIRRLLNLEELTICKMRVFVLDSQRSQVLATVTITIGTISLWIWRLATITRLDCLSDFLIVISTSVYHIIPSDPILIFMRTDSLSHYPKMFSLVELFFLLFIGFVLPTVSFTKFAIK